MCFDVGMDRLAGIARPTCFQGEGMKTDAFGRMLVFFTLILTVPLAAISQSTRLAFEVAAIKLDNQPTGPSRILCHAIDSGMAPGTTPALGRCQATRLTLYQLISTAYGVGLPSISGGP